MIEAPCVAQDVASLPDFDLVLFGGTGDLAMRKLLPALYRRHASGRFRRGPAHRRCARRVCHARGISRAGPSSLPQPTSGEDFDAAQLAVLRQHACTTCASTPPSPADFVALGAMLAGREAVVRVFFLSTAPSLFGADLPRAGQQALVTPHSRVVLEKPLGHDLASARRSTTTSARVFAEHQIFRIDHYLGKETVQNLLALRFANALFEPLWRRGRIDHVQITVAETARRRGRAATSTTRPARCATWCRTTCCSCCASSRWSRRLAATPTRCATRS